MKLFTFLLFTSAVAFSQNAKFGLSEKQPNLFSQYVVIKKDSMSVSEGYGKVIEWINKTYNTPEEVIKGNVKDKYVRMEGVSSGMVNINTVISSLRDAKYSLAFNFKPNKIKMEVEFVKVYFERTEWTKAGWRSYYPTYASNFRKNGKVKVGKMRENKSILDGLNRLVESLKTVINQDLYESNDDW